MGLYDVVGCLSNSMYNAGRRGMREMPVKVTTRYKQCSKERMEFRMEQREKKKKKKKKKKKRKKRKTRRSSCLACRRENV
jgi:hypothetical protein